VNAWRVVKARHQDTAFDGEGARRYGGRFNAPDQRAVYASEHLSLAALETLVHTGVQERQLAYVKLEIEIPDSIVREVPHGGLPDSWDSEPLSPETQRWGEAYLAQYGVLRVPSVIIPEEFNIVINPEHDAASFLEVGDPQAFHWDPRLRSESSSSL
jgi:RES domain-containing protein